MPLWTIHHTPDFFTAEDKRELASREWKYTQHYADAKTEVVEAILLRAETEI